MTMPLQVIVRRDSRAWAAQSWIAFLLAAAAAVFALMLIQVSTPAERVLLSFALAMNVVMSMVVSKFVRDNQVEQVDSPGYKAVVWGGFGLTILGTGWALLSVQANGWALACLGMIWLFLLNSSFTLAKMLRDEFDADLLDAEQQPRP